MNVLDGTVIGRNMHRHRHQEFIRFLNVIEKQVPVGKTIHAIVDNYAAHRHPNVRQWLEGQPRWTFHFTPTSASWLNAVEGFFATLTKRRLKRGVFRSVSDLQAAINRFLEDHNQLSKAFTWTADPDKIIAAVRARVPRVKFDPLAALLTSIKRIAKLLFKSCRFVSFAGGCSPPIKLSAKMVADYAASRAEGSSGGLPVAKTQAAARVDPASATAPRHPPSIF